MPYERPHLSKGYLLGTVSRERLPLRPAAQYRELQVQVVLSDRVLDLDLSGRRVLLESGKTIGWDLLCIATGSDARRLDNAPVYLRELDDVDRLRNRLESREPMRIVGAGFIGSEVAAVARQKGCEVRVAEVLEQPLLKVFGPELGAYIASVHRAHGVHLQLSAVGPVDADLVAIGSVPRTELAEQAGLETDRGIVVDQLGRTWAPNVYAAGDVTRFFHPLYETRVRVEHFQTAQRQGFAVGRTMAGAETPYKEAPWFWSDQYDLNLQYVGAALPWSEVITRGDFGKPPFTVFYLQNGHLIGAAGINDHHTVARARRLMEARKQASAQQLADPRFDLRLAGR